MNNGRRELAGVHLCTRVARACDASGGGKQSQDAGGFIVIRMLLGHGHECTSTVSNGWHHIESVNSGAHMVVDIRLICLLAGKNLGISTTNVESFFSTVFCLCTYYIFLNLYMLYILLHLSVK